MAKKTRKAEKSKSPFEAWQQVGAQIATEEPDTGPEVDHVGIAVRDAKAAAAVYEALGLQVERVEEVPSEGVRTTFLPVGDAHIELLEPLQPDGVIAKFLEKHGEGMHHLAVAVDDIGGALVAAKAAGLEVVGEAPRQGARGRKVAFLHPRSAHGVLLELVENP